eukprot:jgi/Picre1/28699/NNA_004099.t1
MHDQENIDGLGAACNGQAGQRRALGDIGNNIGAGVGGGAKRAGVLTRRAAAQLQAAENGNAQGRDSWGGRPRGGLRPRDEQIPVVGRSRFGDGDEEMRSAVKQRRMDDVDVADAKNPLAAADFVKYIFKSYRSLEQNMTISSTYMSRQQDINEKMRSILIDWLVDVHLKFKLVPETLYLTVNLIDRFLMVKSVSRKHLQLVGVTAMLVASKYEEIWAPEVRDFVYISDRAYNRDQILNMEKIMLNSLKFNLTIPTHYHFLHRFLKVAGLAEDAEAIASASVYATLAKFGHATVHGELQKHSTHSHHDLRECIEMLHTLYNKAPEGSLTAVYKKFSLEKFHNVANSGPPPLGAPMEF